MSDCKHGGRDAYEGAVRVTMELSDGTVRRNMYHLADGTRVTAFDVDGERFARAGELESLVRDMWEALTSPYALATPKALAGRMAELGIEVES